MYNEEEAEVLMACAPISDSWGGRWTEEKLDAFEKYVNAYLTIMNTFRDKHNWKLIYFDGFAGSGSRKEKKGEEDSVLLQDLFKDYFKEFDNLVGKRAEILGKGYAELLEFYTEQNKGLTEMMSSGIQLPKSAQKTQKALNKYIEKYMTEMTKLIE